MNSLWKYTIGTTKGYFDNLIFVERNHNENNKFSVVHMQEIKFMVVKEQGWGDYWKELIPTVIYCTKDSRDKNLNLIL